MRCTSIKNHKILHPYGQEKHGLDLSKMIEVETFGENLYGKPHGLNLIFYIYNGEL